MNTKISNITDADKKQTLFTLYVNENSFRFNAIYNNSFCTKKLSS